MATKILATQNRLFKNIFVCKNCSSKMRSDAKKISDGKVKCRKCGKKHFRQIRKK
jgi:DNA-directed RNA polymerase subunit M/transcription elongation factor TFIIS